MSNCYWLTELQLERIKGVSRTGGVVWSVANAYSRSALRPYRAFSVSPVQFSLAGLSGFLADSSSLHDGRVRVLSGQARCSSGGRANELGCRLLASPWPLQNQVQIPYDTCTELHVTWNLLLRQVLQVAALRQ